MKIVFEGIQVLFSVFLQKNTTCRPWKLADLSETDPGHWQINLSFDIGQGTRLWILSNAPGHGQCPKYLAFDIG